MKLEINGEIQDVAAATLAELLHLLDYEGLPVATARNGAFVRAQDRTQTLLTPDDKIEILMPRQGG